MKQIITLIILVVALVGCEKKKTERTDSRPNIILIFTDDQGYADLGVHKVNKDVKTPHLDLLAKNGIRFTDGYVTAPQCSPSRAGIMTGRYQQRFGMDDNDKGPIPVEEITIAQRLKLAGYTTGMVGKWHLDPNHTSKNWLEKNHPPTLKDHKEPIPKDLQEPYTPSEKGFDYYFWGNMNSYTANYDLDGDTYSKPKHIVDDRYRIDVQTDAAVTFIEENQYEPFFLYLSYFGPHVPLEGDEKYLNRFKDKDMPIRRKYGLSMVAAIDDGVGKILEQLKKHNLDKNTLIFFISDNGAPLKLSKPDTPITGVAGPEWDGSLNDPWIGEKGMLTEGGIRVPFVMYWDGTLPSKVVKWPVSTLDVATTSLAIAEQPADSTLDGINLIPYLTSDSLGAPKRVLFWRFWKQAAVRNNRWKYLHLPGGKQFLFDLKSDQHERKNLIDEHPKIAKRLRNQLRKWSKELKDPGIPKGKLSGGEVQWYKYHMKDVFTGQANAVHTSQ